MDINVLSDANNEPLTLTEVKTHLKIDLSNEDIFLNNLIKSARQSVETLCNISLTKKVIEVYLDNFGKEVRLPNPPLVSLDKFYYYDGEYSENEVPNTVYKLIQFYNLTESRLIIKSGSTLPAYTGNGYGLKLKLTVGFPTDADLEVEGFVQYFYIPEELRLEMLNLIAYWYENRQSEGTIPEQISDKIYKYRLIPL